MFFNTLQIITGNANVKLAESITDYLQRPLAETLVSRFPDGEINVKLNMDVRGSDVFIIQPTCPPRPSRQHRERGPDSADRFAASAECGRRGPARPLPVAPQTHPRPD